MSLSRRQFMRNSALLSSSALAMSHFPPIEKVVDAILRDTIRNAGADTQYIDTKYISLSTFGAPPRWMWDQVLASNPGETITTSPMVLTNYVSSGGTYQTGEYRTFNYKGVMVPILWNTQIPSASGGTRPMSDLLDSMLIFRGYGTGVDGHPSNAVRQTCPVPGAGSVSGWMADYSSSLFKAVQFPNMSTTSGYASVNGTAITVVNNQGANTNYASSLLNPFGSRSETANINSLRQNYADLVDQAQSLLTAMATLDANNFTVIAQDQLQAKQKLKAGIANVIDVWPGLFNKYNNLVQACLQDRSTPGFNDQPILAGPDDGSSGDGPWLLMTDGGIVALQPGSDIRNLMNGADATQMASAFALAEFLILNNFVSSYELGINYLAGLSGSKVRTVGTPSHAPTAFSSSFIFDQHNTGSLVGIYLNSCLYRAMSACLLELVGTLNGANLFGKTVIHMNQEFGRVPRNTAGGSDHHFDGMISSLITGMNTAGPIVIGNILADGTGSQLPAAYSGCTGHKAPTSVSGTAVSLTPTHVASSLAVLLGLPKNPWINTGAPLLSVSGGSIHVKAEGKVVTG